VPAAVYAIKIREENIYYQFLLYILSNPTLDGVDNVYNEGTDRTLL
jgi:hypothetical protein